MLFRTGLLFENFNTLFCSTCSRLIVSSVSSETKEIANDRGKIARVLKRVKIKSFVLSDVVRVLSPLALKSCGGSQIKIEQFSK